MSELNDLRDRIADAIESEIPTYGDGLYRKTADAVLEAIGKGQCAHEWNWDVSKDIYWCKHRNYSISGGLASSPDLVMPSLLDELADRTITATDRPTKGEGQ